MLTKTKRIPGPTVFIVSGRADAIQANERTASRGPAWSAWGATPMSMTAWPEADMLDGFLAFVKTHFDRISAERLDTPLALDMLDLRLVSLFEEAETDADLFKSQSIGLLQTRLLSAFENEPLEDGIAHSAERIISAHFESYDPTVALEAVKSLALQFDNPSFSSSVLQCLGRINLPGNEHWRRSLIREALEFGDVSIRDAAIETAEAWGDESLASELNDHLQFERSPWLRNSIEESIAALRK